MISPALSPNRAILRLALPAVLMNITVPLLGAVDTAVVGRLPEVYYLGAVGIGAMLFNILYWAFSFLRMSTVGLVAQAHGRGDGLECTDVLARGLFLGGALGLLVILLREPILWVAFMLIDASPGVAGHAADYFRIRALAAPAVFMTQVFTGWFFGVQRVAFPVALSLLVNLFNIGLDFLMVVVWGFDSDGVAWASMISQCAGLLITLIWFALHYGAYWRLATVSGLLDWERMKIVMHMNTDLLLRLLSNLFASSLFMARSATRGDLILGANTILIQFRFVALYALDGFAAAAEVMVGSAIGAGNRTLLFHYVRLSLGWGLALGAAFSLCYLIFGDWLIGWFTGNPEVLGLAGVYLIWVVVELWISNFCYTLDGIFTGATGTRIMRNTMVFSVFCVYVPMFFLLEHFFGNHGMWAASLFLFTSRSLTLGWHLLALWRRPAYKLT